VLDAQVTEILLKLPQTRMTLARLIPVSLEHEISQICRGLLAVVRWGL
jgi:hypothetical protein